MLTVLAASDNTYEAVGTVVGRLLLLVLGVVLLVIGLRRRTATRGARGTALAVTGGVLLALFVAGLAGTVATSAA